MTDDQFKQIVVGLLTEIRDALVGVTEEDDGVCHHPEANRVSFATPSFPDHWVCNLCRYEHGGAQES